MTADSRGVIGIFWGLLAFVNVSGLRRSSMSGGAAGGVSEGSVVRVVGNVPACIPGGSDAPLADLQIGSTMLVGMSCS
jgi:hypothetical protein